MKRKITFNIELDFETKVPKGLDGDLVEKALLSSIFKNIKSKIETVGTFVATRVQEENVHTVYNLKIVK